MVSVLHFRRHLDDPPPAPEVPGISVRNFNAPDDVVSWLTLRDQAMAGQTPPVRLWSATDFRSEMQDKPWWSPDRTWLALAADPHLPSSADRSSLVGSITLAIRQGADVTMPVVHWLLVDPAWRRRGIGRLLLSRLERAAWEDGWRQIELESHAGWTAAVAFYHSMGYAPVRERSPR